MGESELGLRPLLSALPSRRAPPALTGAFEPVPQTWTALARDFYERPVVDLARALLGCLVISVGPDGPSAGVVVETEAYGGKEDQASHARAGVTGRTAPMFGQAGHAYVYLVYGMHSCLNVVGHVPGRAGAVLLRGLEPLLGVGLMRARRGPAGAAGPDTRLAAGPARLCQALGVTRALDGHDLTSGTRLWLAAPDAAAAAVGTEVLVGRRVGVDYAGWWAARPWRFGVAGSPALSRPFPALGIRSNRPLAE